MSPKKSLLWVDTVYEFLHKFNFERRKSVSRVRGPLRAGYQQVVALGCRHKGEAQHRAKDFSALFLVHFLPSEKIRFNKLIH